MNDISGFSSWTSLPASRRCRIVAAARREIASRAEALCDLCASEQRTDPVETVSGELLPLCEALRYIGRKGPRLLRPRRFGFWGRPLWLWGVRSEIHRKPLGDVLVIAAWNYPLLLPGVQIAQALAAGNRVWLKPAPGCEAVSEALVSVFHDSGVPADSLQLLDSAPQAAVERIAQGVDLVVVTGSSGTGRSVMAQCAQTLTPSIMELSGCDAVVVGPGADLRHVAEGIAFGLLFNSGASCIGPRRIIVRPADREPLIDRLKTRFADAPTHAVHPAARKSVAEAVQNALDRGGVDVLATQPPATLLESGRMQPMILDGVQPDWPIASADLFAPIASILVCDSDEAGIAMVNGCRYRLAASVFGSRRWAGKIAERLEVGHVSINDLIVPTADPRVPFGGNGESGFGVTRGAEGLLAMTRPQVIAVRRSGPFLHLRRRSEGDYRRLLQLLRLSHGRRRD